MHSTTRRIVSLIAAVALLITCTIAGLVLPIAAEEQSDVIYSLDFQNGTDGWKFAGKTFETVEDPADPTNLVAAMTGKSSDNMLRSPELKMEIVGGQRYMLRVKTKTENGTKTRIVSAFYNEKNGGYRSMYYDTYNTEWMYYVFAFTADHDASSLEFGFYLETAGVTLYIDDIELVKIGETSNYVAGGDMEGIDTYFLKNYYSFGATVVKDELEEGNHALHVPTGSSGLWFAMSTNEANKIYEVSFRYRGGSIKHWWSSEHSALYQNVGSTKASSTWQQFKTYIHTNSTTTGNHLMIRTDNNTALNGVRDVWLDDIVVREVTAVALPETATIGRGETTTLTPALTPADAAITTYTWESDAAEIATVENGVVTAVAEGTANITVKAGPLSATCAVTVTKPSATGLALDKDAISLLVGETDTLTASIVPEDAELPGEVQWSTQNDKVATVVNGVVTAVGAGETTITATAGTLSATCTVTVKKPPEFVFPNGNFEESDVSGFKKSDKSDVPILTDSKDGNKYIQIPANGALITGPVIDYTVQSGDWFRVSFKVRKNASAKMRFGVNMYNVFSGYARPDWIMEDSASTSGNGEWFQYTAYAQAKNTTSEFYLGFLEISANTTADTPLDLDDIEIELLDVESNYELNRFYGGDFENGNIASLNDYGFGGLFNDGGVIVEDPTDSTNHVLHMTSSSQAYFLASPYTMQSGDTKTNYVMQTNSYYVLSYRQKGTGTTTPSISSSYGSRLSVTGAPGTASEDWKTITAYFKTGSEMNSNYCFNFKTSGNVYLDDFTLYRIPAATAIALEAEETEVTVGATLQLNVATTPSNAYIGTITWTSSDNTIATVADGVVTGVSEGTATITATDGTLTATFDVTVNKLMATELTINKQALTLLLNTSETLTASALPVGGWFDTIVWSTSDANVVTVDGGVVTAVGAGEATIVATAGDLTATCVVIVPKDLVTGGDFEEGRIGTFANVGADSTKTWYIAEGEGFGGGNALAINYKKSDRLLVWPTFTPSTTYELSFVAKGPEILLQCWKYSGSASGWSTIYTTDIGGGWTQYHTTFTTSANGWGPSTDSNYAKYGFIMNRSATLEDTTAVTYVDNFSIKVSNKEGERIYGGDFNIPAPQQWKKHFALVEGGGVVTEADGNKAFYFPASASQLGDQYMPAVELKASTDYILSFRAKGDPVDWYINPSYLSGTTGWYQTKASSDYVNYAFTFSTTGTLNKNFYLNLTRQKSGATGTELGTWIDNVSIVEANVDLTVDEFFVLGGKSEVKPGAKITFGVKITNNGTNAVVGTFPVDFRMNGNVVSTTLFDGTIKAGETITVLASDVWTAVEGNYTASVKINGDLSVLETDIQNNGASYEIRVANTTLAAPSYAQSAGYDKLVFADDFDSIDTIDTKATGEAGYKWYVTRPYGASTLTTDDYKVENGILTLQENKPTYNYGLATMDVKTGNGFTFNKGYLEVKFRIPRPRKNTDEESGVPAIWSLPADKLMTNKSNHWVEMDWMEYWGINAFNKYFPKGYYTISMHEIALNTDGTTKYQVKNDNYGLKGLGDAAWHTMGWLWDENQIVAYLDGTKVFTQQYSADSKGTPTVDKVSGTVPNGVYTLLNDQVMPLIISGSADNPMEVDYVRIWQNSAEEVANDIAYTDVTMDGGDIAINEAGALDETVSKGDTVTVNVKPNEGYIMKPGSLKYVTESGEQVSVLNQSLTDFTFGGGDGYSFEFKMPEGATKVTAEFVSTESTNFAMDTIGTSIYDNGSGNYDGIRFLSRMNMATKFDANANTMMVKYQGVEYEVIEIGSLLKRYEENATLNLEDYKWRSKAYVKGGDMSLVDYTDSYIDFTVIMKKGATVSYDSFYARKYMSRGYIILKDASGNQKTVLCDTILTNSVNGAVAAAN